MAGSWRHMTTRTGKLRRNDSFVQMIENLGDAYEAAEECYGMIWWLAANVLTGTAEGDARPLSRDRILAVIAEAEAHYREGLELGGVQRDR